MTVLPLMLPIPTISKSRRNFPSVSEMRERRFFWPSILTQMRIFFVALFVILGANLMIELLDSNMMEVMQKRNETIQKSIEKLWRLSYCPLLLHGPANPCILDAWGRQPHSLH